MYKIFYFFIFINQSALLRTVTLTIFSQFSRDSSSSSSSTNAKKSSSIDHLADDRDRQIRRTAISDSLSVSIELGRVEKCYTSSQKKVQPSGGMDHGWQTQKKRDRRVRSRSHAGCINQSFSLPVWFVGVASPPVQCSKTGLKKRDMKCWVVAMCARSYSPVPLFPSLMDGWMDDV